MSAEKHRTEVRQNEIARAALDLISRRGMKGLRVAAVAKKVGLVPSGIYRHYRNKDEVLDAILDYIHHRLNANVRATSRVEGNALTRLHALLMKHIALIRENEAIPFVIFSAEVYTESPRRRLKLRGIIESYLSQVADLVETGQQEKTVRTDLVPGTVAMLFLGLIQPSTILWHLSAGQYDVTAQAEAAWPMFCRAIQSENTTERKKKP